MSDAWHPTVTADLRRLQAALHDIIDIPHDDDPPPKLVKVTRGHPAERAARRGNDRDADYATIPDPDIRPPHTISDPTYAATGQWAGRIETACTQLDTLTGEWHTAVATSLHPFGRDVRTGDGRPWPPPDPPTYVTGSGRTMVSVAPSQAGRLVRRHIVWMQAAADALQDWRTHPSCHDQQLHARLANLQRHTRRLVDRHRPRQSHVTGPTRCVNPHGLHNHPAGPKPLSGVCRRCREDGWCDSCGIRQPATFTNADGEERDRSECWSCIGKAKRARQEQNA